MIVGEAPGEEEARTGVPFVGKSGKLLRAELSRAGINSVYITNSVKCRPPQNRKPTNDEIKACRKYLDAELQRVKPKFLVAAGATASKTVLKDAKITTVHGKIIEEIRGMPFGVKPKGYPIFHPAYVLRDPGHFPVFRADLERLSRELGGKRKPPEVTVKIIDKENLDEFVTEFTEADRFSFDIESSGLFPWAGTGLIRCVAFGLPNQRAWVIRGHMPDSPFSGHPDSLRRFIRLVVQMAARHEKWGVAQNGKFDNNWLHVYTGARFLLDFDTMIAHHTLDENAPHDLEVMARNELDVEEYDIPLQEKNGTVAWKLFNAGRREEAYENCRKVYEYGGKDAVYTLMLAERYQAKFRKDSSLRRLFQNLIMPANAALGLMESVGLTIDGDKRLGVKAEVTEARDGCLGELNQMAEAAKAAFAVTGTEDEKLRTFIQAPSLNWNAPQQVARLFYEVMGLECTLLTDGGNPSTSEQALLDLAGQHPICDKLIEYRKFEKFLNTYIDGWDELMHDGRLYVSYKQHGTVTGRYSSRLHSIPRDGTIRNLATAPDGWEFFQADVSQAELRIVCEMSGDPEMQRCFAPGGPDIHWRTVMAVIESGGGGDYYKPAIQTAQHVSGNKHVSLDQAISIILRAGHERCIKFWSDWKEARKKGKAVNFGFVFGMYENKFIETTKINYGFEPTWNEAHEYRGAFFRLYSRVEPWHNAQKALARVNGEVRNFAGRIRRLPSINSGDREARGEAERQAINSPVQGFIGDWKAAAMVEITEDLPRDRIKLVGEHHDALLGIVRKDSLHLLARVRKIMKNPRIMRELGVKLQVPMESEIEVGNWGAGKAWTDDLKKVKK